MVCQVLLRAGTALEMLAQAAVDANVNCVAAVSHSTLLHVILALLLDEPLLPSAMARKIYNASITVIDVPIRTTTKATRDSQRTISRKSKLLLPKDFALQVPMSQVIRINEYRHLPPSTLLQVT